MGLSILSLRSGFTKLEIKPQTRTLRELAKSHFWVIPEFQRPYSWTIQNIDDLWSDVLEADEPDYFVGSIVIYNNKKDVTSISITDGQQRLATLSIFLAALRDVAIKNSATALSETLHDIIERKDEETRNPRFMMRYEIPNLYFANSILALDSVTVTEAISEEEKTQKLVYEHLVDRISEYIEEVSTHAAKTRRLSSLKDKLLGLQFVEQKLTNEDDAFIVFEVLNSRGKDLETSDLLKNHFVKLFRKIVSNDDLSPVSNVWGEIRQRFESADNQVSFDTFLLHYWWSTEKYVSKKNLYREMRAAITEDNAKVRLSDIRNASIAYVTVASPSDSISDKNHRKIRKSLEATNIFNVEQARPLLLSIMRAYYEKDFAKPSKIEKLLRSIENFTFQFNAVTSSRGGGGIIGMYSRLAKLVHDSTTAQGLGEVTQEVKSTFAAREISDEEFAVKFQEISYSNSTARQKKLVRYILSELHENVASNVVVDFSEYTIEHLRPQSRPSENGSLEKMPLIGNLLFIPNPLNEQLGSKSFAEKKATLLSSGDSFLLIKDWELASNSEIDARGVALASIAKDKVWKIS